VCHQGSLVVLYMKDYKSLRAVVMIWATPFDPKLDHVTWKIRLNQRCTHVRYTYFAKLMNIHQ